MNTDLVDLIVQITLDTYNNLPKTGKPTSVEWTVLCSVVKIQHKHAEVVSLGTGSKCIGATKMCPKGLTLNDSHAEVMARRGFLVYLYDKIEKALESKDSIFIVEDGKFKLKENIEFVFYSSQLPCGDASIIRKDDDELWGDVIIPRKRQIDESDINNQTVIHSTGAKCLPDCEENKTIFDIANPVIGKVRTKPGRGDRTLSVSCSDKIAKWIHLGIQGSLLSLLLKESIHMKYFIFGANVPFCKKTLYRALIYRNTKIKMDYEPDFYQTSVIFSNVKSQECSKPAPGSIVWIKLDNFILEVAVMGKKLGITKKNKNSEASSLCISKKCLFKRFLSILKKEVTLKNMICPELSLECAQYDNVKSKSKDYLSKWIMAKENIFKTWTAKPKMWNFNIENI